MNTIKKLALVTLLLVTAACPAWAIAATSADSAEFFQRYDQCRQIEQSIDRLLCYDHLLEDAQTVDPAQFQQQKLAQPTTEQRFVERDQRLNDQQQARAYQRLSSNDPNFFGYAYPPDDELGDEAHLEFFISQKYALVEPWFNKFRYVKDPSGARTIREHRAWIPDRLFFIYNGQFDFYAGDSDRYESSPIISRRQNPGLALEWDFPDPRSKFRLGYFHESNGQSLGPSDPESPDPLELLAAQREFALKNERYGADFALAQVSRGWDFWSLRYQKSRRSYLADFDPEWYQLQAELRVYSDDQLFGGSREDAIWWEPGNQARIEDFDGLRLLAEGSYGTERFPFLARIEYRGGVSDFDALGNASWKLTLGIKALNTRFTAFYFNGYGREPSTYHLRTDYVGLGLEFR